MWLPFARLALLSSLLFAGFIAGCPDGADDGNRPSASDSGSGTEDVVAPDDGVPEVDAEAQTTSQEVSDEGPLSDEPLSDEPLPDEHTPTVECEVADTLVEGAPIESSVGEGVPALSKYSCPELQFSDFDGNDRVFEVALGCLTTATVEMSWSPGPDAQDLAIALLTGCAADTCIAAGLGDGGTASITFDVAADETRFVAVDSRGTADGPFTITLTTTGCCNPVCVGDCGDDGCGGSCGTCDDGQICDAGQCVCVPQCAGKDCGEDGCGGSCDPGCDDVAVCVSGQCCFPQCGGRQCGDNGCGGTCGPGCDPGVVCEAGQCACVPDCQGKMCGDDACGGSCGPGCAPGEQCVQAGVGCEPIVGAGCAVPIVIDPAQLPFTSIGDTTGFSNLLSTDFGCGPEADLGDQAADVVFSFTPTITAEYGITMPGYSAGDANLVYVITDCADLSAGCVGFNDFAGAPNAAPEVLSVSLQAGVTYYVVVDSLTPAEQGPYHLRVAPAPPVGAGCEAPVPIEALPFDVTGDTTGFGSNVSAQGGCGTAGDLGAGVEDIVYRFLAPQSGQYQITMPDVKLGDARLLYVLRDCDDPAATCVGLQDFDAPTDAGQSLIVPLEAGTEYLIVVDGGGPYHFVLEFLPNALVGDTCELPFPVGPLPWSAAANTDDFANDYDTANGCGLDAALGDEEPDVVYAFTPTADSDYIITLPGFVNGDPSLVYVTTACADIADACVGGNDFWNPAGEAQELVVSMDAGTTYYIVVDSAFPSDTGPFAIAIEAACTPDCGNKACGDDGCGGSCGSCASDESCNDDQSACVLGGDRCDTAFVVGVLPFEHTATTISATDDYSTGGGCGSFGDIGAAVPDLVYSFTPSKAGEFRITMPGFANGQPSVVYVVSDCADTAGTCSGYADFFGSSDADPDDLLVTLDGGTTYYVIVDSFSAAEAGAYTLRIDEVVQPGDECTDAIELSGALPITAWGDNTLYSDSYSTKGGCGTVDAGANNPDVAYRFDPPLTGTYAITMPGFVSGGPSVVSVVVDCAQPSTTCLGYNDFFGSDLAPETLEVSLEAGVPAFVIVDSLLPSEIGEFVVRIDLLCAPDCAGKVCGDDGCGGSCGACLGSCSADGSACLLAGATCETATVIDPASLPFTGTGDTSSLTNDYSTANQCGSLGDVGDEEADAVFSFTPTFSGDYTVTMPGYELGDPSIVYVTSDCVDLNGGCFEFIDFFVADSLNLSLDAGTTYFVIIDSLFGSEQGPFEFVLSAAVPSGGSCSDPTAVGSLPFQSSGNTDLYTDLLSVGGGCGAGGDGGAGVPEAVFAFTPSADGEYQISMPDLVLGQPTLVYVVTDCADVQGSCVGFEDFFGTSLGATLDVTLLAGVTYHVVVDGLFPNETGPFQLRIAEPPLPGDTCETATVIDPGALPFSTEGDNSGLTNAFSTAGGCGTGNFGVLGRDAVLSFTPALTSQYAITMPGFVNGEPSLVTLVTDCQDVGGSCVGYHDFFGSSDAAPEQLLVTLEAGVTYTLIVDSLTSVEEGAFELALDIVLGCEPVCATKVCGEDGCGGSCGACAAGSSCSVDGSECIPDPPVAGDTCESAIAAVGPFPILLTGDNTNAADDYSTGGGCGTGDLGIGKPDLVFAFEAPLTGNYRITMPGFQNGDPSLLYVVTDCSDVGGSCVAYNDYFNSSDLAPEVLTIPMEAGTAYFVIVDSLSSSEIGSFAVQIQPQ